MAVHGYITHAAQNRRKAIALVAVYIASFQALGAFALALPLLFWDPGHTVLGNPAGYLLRYALPLAALSWLIFHRIARGHAKTVASQIGARTVTRADEPRFVALAEEACTTLGVRFPRFAVIEHPEPNAVTVGEGPDFGLIAVTRGLLESLDDDELLGVLAHEASHIRLGDTRVLAANHAMMRTAVVLQTHNPFRIEDWRLLFIPLLLPPFLTILLISGAVTTLSMQAARFARRGIKLSRDHIADGEAIRATHFPEALHSAIAKIGGKGAFPGCWRFEAMLFDGRTDREGGTHPSAKDRQAAIVALGKDLFDPGRQRRDTRTLSAGQFGRRPAPARRSLFEYDSEGRPLYRPPVDFGAFLRNIRNYFVDREAFDEYQSASVAWHEWRVSDQRNVFGIRPGLVIPVAALTAFLLVLHWPTDNDPAKFVRKFSPGYFAELMSLGSVNSGTFCEGQGCGRPGNGAQLQGFAQATATPEGRQWAAAARPDRQPDTGPPDLFQPTSADNFMSSLVFLLYPFLLILMVVHRFRPGLLRSVAASLDRATGLPPKQAPAPRPPAEKPRPRIDAPPKPEARSEQHAATDLSDFDRKIQQRLDELAATRDAPASPPQRAQGFGRKGLGPAG